MKFNLSWFDATTYTTTIYKDSGITSATASPTSGTVEKGATVTISVTPASGYELDTIDVVSGGVTITYGTSAITFTMGEANVVLNVKSKSSTKYKVTENCYTCVNGGTPVMLVKNIVLGYGPNGDIVELTCTGTDCSSLNASVLAQLVEAGILIKM